MKISFVAFQSSPSLDQLPEKTSAKSFPLCASVCIPVTIVSIAQASSSKAITRVLPVKLPSHLKTDLRPELLSSPKTFRSLKKESTILSRGVIRFLSGGINPSKNPARESPTT